MPRLAVGAIGAGVSAYGQVEQGQATAEAANYQAQVARNNELIANQNAAYSIQAGQAKAAATSLQGAQTMGKIKAGQAASGIDVNTGSAVGVQTSEREVSKLDTATVLNNAELEAYGYRTQAAGYGAQAGLENVGSTTGPDRR